MSDPELTFEVQQKQNELGKSDGPAALSTDRRSISFESTSSQAASLLGLPLEIRDRIISEVLGNRVIHITFHSHRRILQAWISEEPGPTQILDPIREYLLFETLCLPPWLQTCRQLYLESSRILYTTNTFNICGVSSLTCLSRSLPLNRLQMIRSLRFTWHGKFKIHHPNSHAGPMPGNVVGMLFPFDLGGWGRAWDIVAARMKGLKNLQLTIKIQSSQPAMDWLESFTTAIQEKLRGLGTFDLELFRTSIPEHMYPRLEPFISGGGFGGELCEVRSKVCASGSNKGPSHFTSYWHDPCLEIDK
jgi:hypothetical protein